MNEATEASDKLAAEILVELNAVPTLTVDRLAYRLDATQQEVADVIDSYEVIDGEPVFNGPGQGGSWLPPEHRVQITAPFDVIDQGKDIGNRWPDGSLREEVFNIDNPEHVAEMSAPVPGTDRPADS